MTATAMGTYIFTCATTGNKVKVYYTFGYKRLIRMEKYVFIYIIHLFLFQINRIYKIKKQKLKKLKCVFLYNVLVSTILKALWILSSTLPSL